MRKLSLACFAAVLAGSASAAVLFDNGGSYGLTNHGLATGTVAANGSSNAPAGTEWSEMHEENQLLGSNADIGRGFSVAADFMIESGWTWTVEKASFFVYQRFAAANSSPATAVHLQVWNGRPGDSGSSVIFGDLSTNRLLGSSFSNMYRIGPSVGASVTPPNTQRPIFKVDANMGGLELTSGQYWLEWRVTFEDSPTQTPFVPPLTMRGSRGLQDFNGRVYLPGFDTPWQDAKDGGLNGDEVGMDYPFTLEGSAVPEPGTMIALGAGALALAARRRRKA